MATKKILCIDWDGVIHSYTSGWTSADDVPDPPVPGALDFLRNATHAFDVYVYSSRSHQPGGIEAMQTALQDWYVDAAKLPDDVADEDASAVEAGIENFVLNILKWPTFKPSAFLTIDDRVHCFDGRFPAIDSLLAFQPWNRK